ncbi:hypothetical protein HON52_05025 [Candidatus Uhrbacteria bacterium]|nr:hypothetical protein [Candidatus Uhrbacteria bacterium]
MTLVTTRLGAFSIQSHLLRWVSGDRVMVYTGDDSRTGLDCGYVLTWNEAQQLYHSSTSLDLALAASRHIGTGYGWNDRHKDGELQKLRSWIARERHLLHLCIDLPGVRTARRARFQRECAALATEMGRPINKYKRTMLSGVIRAGDEIRIQRAGSLAEASEAGIARIGQIRGISPFIDMRRVAMLRDMHHELNILREAHTELIGMRDTLLEAAMTSLRTRQCVFDRIGSLSRKLNSVVHRPMRNVCRRTVQDDLQPMIKVLTYGPVREAEKYIDRAIQALHIFLTHQRPLAALRFRLSLALAYSGQRRRTMVDELYDDLMFELNVLREGVLGENDKGLRNPPLERALRHLTFARLEWDADRLDWKRVKEQIDKACAPF